jgi:hypothetical protein
MSTAAGNMPAADQISEIAELLAAGLTRLKVRKSSGNFGPDGESSLHCSIDRSSHHPVLEKRERA